MSRSLFRQIAITSVAAFALSACGSGNDTTGTAPTSDAVGKVAAPAGSAWSAKVTKTPAGGFLMGNPDAPIKLIEYASLTCGACAQFSETASPELKKDFVDTGRVSVEFRNYVRDPVDLTAAALIHCAGADRFFPLTENVLAAQQDLFAGVQANGAAAEAAMQLPENQRFPAFAKAAGLDVFFQARGMTGEQVNACLSDMSTLKTLETIRTAGDKEFSIPGTPTFVLNGEVVATGADWPGLKAKLQAAGAR